MHTYQYIQHSVTVSSAQSKQIGCYFYQYIVVGLLSLQSPDYFYISILVIASGKDCLVGYILISSHPCVCLIFIEYF